jgi:hypothetical protein
MELQLAQAMLPSFEAWAEQRRWQRLQFTLEHPYQVLAFCELLARPLALSTHEVELVVVHSDFARSRLWVLQAEGRTEVMLKPQLPVGVHLDWSEKLVRDAMAMVDAVASRPNLQLRLQVGNLKESPARAALIARVTALGG